MNIECTLGSTKNSPDDQAKNFELGTKEVITDVD